MEYLIDLDHRGFRSHGLGNPHQNAIPTCQLKKIYQFVVTAVGAQVALWLDTLCVPVSARYRQYRKVALFKMRETYANATQVLVLDACLQEVGDSIHERRLQIVCSEWMRRLWTLQEALLPKPENLLIQFRHNAVPLSSLVDESMEEGLSEIWHSVEVQSVQLLRRQFPKTATDEDHLLVLARSLQRRSTTKAEDEPICLATLMDVPLEQFNNRPSMAQIIGILQIVPQGILFIPGPRMTTPGFRWAPLSFLSQRSSQISHSQANRKEDAMPSTITPRGILVVKPSIFLQNGFTFSRAFIEFAKVAIRTNSGVEYGIRASTDLDASCSQLRPRYLSSAAVIFQRRDFPPSELDAMHAVLVSDVKEEGGQMYCHYEIDVIVSWVTEFFGCDPTEFLQGKYEGPKTWCID